jgi:hypothetical protein
VETIRGYTILEPSIPSKETAVAKKPDRVELLEQGIVKLILKNSDEGSLNDKKDPQTGRVYKGRATSVEIFGPKGAGVTFYDDQKFRTGQNPLGGPLVGGPPAHAATALRSGGRDGRE